jgi:hypothetical protein
MTLTMRKLVVAGSVVAVLLLANAVLIADWLARLGLVGLAQGVRQEYVTGTPKAILRRFEQYLIDTDWQEVQAGVDVKLVPGPDGAETFILARSADRRKKEQAMHERFCDRMEAGLTKLRASLESGRLKDEAVAQRRLGRLQERYWRAAGAFEVTIKRLSSGKGNACLSMTWKRRQRWSEWTSLSEGCYLLRTNLTESDWG